ncbi:hypothetical protein SEA_NHAGOS_72 [Gordonia phage NHagos]|nr:hypothetical protein SEA_NHAGOS_72 [Gordonia phage NHagos]
MFGITREDIDTAAGWVDFDPEEDVRTDYSGRGMYGRTCVGYEGENAAAFLAAIVSAALVRTHDSDVTCWDVVDAMGDIRTSTDSMGRGMITYWPGLRLVEE